LDTKKTAELGWYLPRKKQSYVNRLSSLLQDPNLINKQLEDLPGQYYLLKEYFRIIILQKRAAGIQLSFQKKKSLQPRDTSDVILQIRKRLFITGDLIIDSRQNLIMSLEGVLKYKKRNGFTPDSLLYHNILKT
jgi:hypothetical protein